MTVWLYNAFRVQSDVIYKNTSRKRKLLISKVDLLLLYRFELFRRKLLIITRNHVYYSHHSRFNYASWWRCM